MCTVQMYVFVEFTSKYKKNCRESYVVVCIRELGITLLKLRLWCITQREREPGMSCTEKSNTRVVKDVLYRKVSLRYTSTSSEFFFYIFHFRGMYLYISLCIHSMEYVG